MAETPARVRKSRIGWAGVRRGAFVVLLGAAMGLGHDLPAFGLAITLMAFLLALRLVLKPHARATGLQGWLLGVGYFGWTLRWIVEPFLVDIARHGWMAPFALVLMAGGLALFWGLAFWGAHRLARGQGAVVLWLPVTLTLAELARGHLFTGFPWGLLSYTAIGGPADVWLAWVGPYGATALLVATVCTTHHLLTRRPRWLWVPLVLGAVATAGLQGLSAPVPSPSDQIVRLVQPNAPQHLKWDRDWMPVFFDRALAATGAGDGQTVPDAVIWPETSIPSLLNYAAPLTDRMAQAARGAPVVAGVQRREGEAYYNSAIVIDGPDMISDVVDKRHLVPFGEYIPFAELLRPLGLSTLVDQVAGFSAGTGTGLMEVGGLGLVRVLICYEGIFPEEIDRGGPRPDVLLILTNDAWFGANAGPRQHLAQARARAIEQGIPVIRAANTGISAVIDGRGRILDSLPLNTQGFLDAPVPTRLPVTLYARLGDWPLAVLLAFLIAGRALRRRAIVVDRTPPQE
ncbi:apolipoprotein N-acyltransferase [Thalassorhabdomicrobium marinisediminis]|uniref:apolipoprotein N-acyltransferase n=1 Tax=Thalassorhabdomicrobium marinisediminis TaxID=2170577 RepID=UPI001F542774|nr:apolipoprotein N-acyltransferase [Thalassorhabdomicrobium marinisediminis]